MAAMKLYFGENPVGGEVDLADFDKLQTDVDGKYDKGNETAIPDGKRDYADAAAMESAVKGNTSEIHELQDDFLELVTALQEGKPNLEIELTAYFPKYGDDDNDQEALIYDSAAKMGVVVQRNEQAIIDNQTAITVGDAATLDAAKAHADAQDATNLQAAKNYADTQDATTLASANAHSDANDTATLEAANEYTDDEIAKIPDVEGIIEVEENAVRNSNKALNFNPNGGVENIAVVTALPADVDANTLYVVTG